jgi:uncharacterized protein (DUF1684 family)
VSNYTRHMRQDATYWPPASNDGFGGRGYGVRFGVKCRWEDRSVLFRDSQGTEVTSSAVVYVDRPLAIGGKLVLGFNTSSKPPADALEIRQVGTSPDLRNEEVLNKVWL